MIPVSLIFTCTVPKYNQLNKDSVYERLELSLIVAFLQPRIRELSALRVLSQEIGITKSYYV